MTTSIDPSVDELLLLQENQCPIPNITYANIKPIGAERKIGQPSNSSTEFIYQTKSSLLSLQQLTDSMNMDIQENENSLNAFEIPSLTSYNSSTKPSTKSIYDNIHFSSIEEPIIHERNNQLESLIYHPFHNHSSSSTTHSLRSHSYLLDNCNHQPQTSPLLVQQKLNHSISTQIQTGKTISSFRIQQTYPTNQLFIPNSSQLYLRNPFFNFHQQTRPIPPMFTTPFQCTRERFQVNSIGRPILRTNNYTRLSQTTGFKVRR